MSFNTIGLVDTNLLVFAADTNSPYYQPAYSFLKIVAEGDLAVITPQILLESYNVLVSFGWSPKSINNYISTFRSHPGVTTIFPKESTHLTTLKLAQKHHIQAKRRIFDLYLAQTAVDNQINLIYTQNTKDFLKPQIIQAINPLQ